jgi:hypothetical protein
MQNESSDDGSDNEKNKMDEEDDPIDEFIAEQEASRRVTQRLMFPRLVASSISQTVTAMAWLFLISSFVLQALGYSFIVDDAGLRIDTLEAKQFQDEIAKSIKESTR